MRFKAFVSSTFVDLERHRARAIAELRKAGVNVDPMEEWPATSSEPKRFSRERVDGCDFCVLLVGLRRGFVPPGEQRSITQMEYDEAVERGLEVFVYMVKENAPWPRSFDELDADAELRPWREHLMVSHGVEFFDTDPESLDVTPAVVRWITSPGRLNQGAGEISSSATAAPSIAESPSANAAPPLAESGSASVAPPSAKGPPAAAKPPPPKPVASSPPDADRAGDVASESTGMLGSLTLERVSSIVFSVGFGLVVLMVVANMAYRNFMEDSHLRSPQRLTLSEYLQNPEHPRAGPLFFLSATPSAEVVLTDLEIAHVDEDSILLRDAGSGSDVLVPGDGMDAFGLSVGQSASLQVGRLEQTALGWIPAAPESTDALYDRFDRDEMAALEQWKIVAPETEAAASYMEGELSFSNAAPEADHTVYLPDLAGAEDLPDQLDGWNEDASTLAIRGARLVGQDWLRREPYFIVEIDDARWAAVVYDPQKFSEWYWAMDRLQGEEVVARGVPRASDDADFPAIAASRSQQLVLVLDGYAISSPDGETVIHLATRDND